MEDPDHGADKMDEEVVVEVVLEVVDKEILLFVETRGQKKLLRNSWKSVRVVRTPQVPSRNYWNYVIEKPNQMANRTWTLKQEMETDDDHAARRESFSLVQNLLL